MATCAWRAAESPQHRSKQRAALLGKEQNNLLGATAGPQGNPLKKYKIGSKSLSAQHFLEADSPLV